MTLSTPRTDPPELEGSRVVVVGAARSGTALARFLMSRRAEVVLTDSRKAEALGEEVAALSRNGVVLELGGHDEDSFLRADLVAVSPGVPLDAPPLAAARRKGIRVVSEIEVASWFLKGTVIGITGTNGKSTTTALTAHLLEDAGLKAFACGNLGTPLIEFVEEDATDRYYVVELSSFQLEGIETFRPRIASMINLSPDHQDRYRDQREYYAAKARIFLNQQPADHAVLNYDDAGVRGFEPTVRARVHPFSTRQELDHGAFVRHDAIVVRRQGRDTCHLPLSEIPLAGAHNLENVMTSLLIADLCGVPMPKARRGVGTFQGLPHRMEKVRDRNSVTWYNDSKATNVGAAARALQSFPGPVVLILGGRDKGGAFADLAPLVHQNVTLLILMGEAREVIAAQLEVRVPTVMAADMSDAVRAADAAATQGTVVLLAPACTSFDQYAGYEARGDDFRARVNALPGHGVAAPERPVKGC